MPQLYGEGRNEPLEIPWGLDRPMDVANAATILKLAESPAYVLLDHAEGLTNVARVNGIPVLKFKIIRHGDRLTLGGQRYMFSEFQKVSVGADSPFLGEHCLSLQHPIELGDKVVVCRCGRPHHLVCWLVAERCGHSDCAYPHRNLLVKFLIKEFIFETLTTSSPLIGQRCSNPTPYSWDSVPFGSDKRKPTRIVYCPSCKIPYHEACWLSFEKCPTPKCGYKVREKVDAFFSLALSWSGSGGR